MTPDPLPQPVVSPPPPHDPRDREATLRLGAWEVRVSTGRAFECFVQRGLWHVQLWHAEAKISILTPSRLTGGAYEAFPSHGWKARSQTYEGLVGILEAEHGVRLPSVAQVHWVERQLVDKIVASAGATARAS
ncbi:MAG: hypothetical protein KIS78_27160 [Labilithrix sp.]|nr:hypothetical protein [Labilithrix sp.]MCW5836110.1 hypothetical protein [Labilithrix sp.]